MYVCSIPHAHYSTIFYDGPITVLTQSMLHSLQVYLLQVQTRALCLSEPDPPYNCMYLTRVAFQVFCSSSNHSFVVFCVPTFETVISVLAFALLLPAKPPPSSSPKNRKNIYTTPFPLPNSDLHLEHTFSLPSYQPDNIMAAADAANVRTVAVQLRTLSADEDNQPIIAREEGCMHALCGFIVGEDVEVASIAVAAIKNLASHPDNFDVLRSEEGLLDGLKDLILADEADRSLREDIFHVIEELTNEINDYELDELEELERKAGLKQEQQTGGFDNDPNLLADPVTCRLHVPGISDEMICARVEQLIIRERGVISISFEIGAETAVIFTRLPPDQLAAFLARMTGSKVEILPDDVESEEEESEGESQYMGTNVAGDVSNKENGNNQPGYLDETGQRLRDVARHNAKKKHTITQGASSLHELLKAEREDESRKKARANRLMDSFGHGVRTGWGFF